MFNERMTDYIEGHFKDCLKSSSFTPSYYPHIQPKEQERALKGFVQLLEPDETFLMIYDTTLFGKCKNGLAITDKAVYFRDIFDETRICSFRSWRPNRDNTQTILNISDSYTFISSPFLDNFITEICTIKSYDGLFEAEEKK